LLGQARDFGKFCGHALALNPDLPIKRRSLSPQGVKRGLRSGKFGTARTQITLTARCLTANTLRPRQGFGQLAVERDSPIPSTARRQIKISQARAQPVTVNAQAIAFQHKAVTFITQQRQGLLRRIPRCGGATQILLRAAQLLAQLIGLACLQGQQFGQFRHTAVQDFNRLFAR
jgi:hypothetical protein